MDAQTSLRLAALSGASAVLLGAFGAHGLAARTADPKLLKTWETAAHYQLVHAAVWALCAVGGNRPAGALFATGSLLFSGSLYALVLSGRRWLGAVTPVGGVLLTCGWLALCAWGIKVPLPLRSAFASADAPAADTE